jgi:hypothetical protein
MAKETAVQWMARVFGIEIDYKTEIAELMEKEQMYQVWLASEQWSDGKFVDSNESFEEYYNETYGKDI